MAVASNTDFRVWQWNCCGFKKKKTVLAQYLRPCESKPQVILLQETITPGTTFSGYESFERVKNGGRGVVTLVKRGITVIEHEDIDKRSNAEYVCTELLPGKNMRRGLLILNVYSSPRRYDERFYGLIGKAVKMATDAGIPLVVAGDFNAPHSTWGYVRDSPKGVSICKAIQDFHLTLLTDSGFPTRIGNSVTRPSTPDLSLVAYDGKSSWRNMGEDLGSDHIIIEMTLHAQCKTTRIQRIVDWDLFRSRRRDKAPPNDYGEWIETLFSDVSASTKETETEEDFPTMDSHLAHMFEAKMALKERWAKNKLNRSLRKRIAKINAEIASYSKVLEQKHWVETCDKVDGQMRVGGKWNLLKHLLKPTDTRAAQRSAIERLAHRALTLRSKDWVMNDLAAIHLPPDTISSTLPRGYAGNDSGELDGDISEWEVRSALHKLNSTSAPGADRVTNRMLRNLDDKSVTFLTDLFNKHWKNGSYPQEWKHATVILIPKPGKKCTTENLRPISLTSCVGKIFEHVINDRVSKHIERNELFPPNMVGFRPHLSTQDAMLLIKSQVIDASTRDPRVILALDLKKAFDTILHDHILEAISELGLGRRFFDFVRQFLSGRTATIRLGEVESDKFQLGNTGTPQGAVISPLLFNIGMTALARELDNNSDIGSAIYADDITVWSRGGSVGHTESTLQEAVRTVEKHLSRMQLALSGNKSELLVYQPIRMGRRPKGWRPTAEIDIHLITKNGAEIPRKDTIRVLGMLISENGRNAATIQKLQQHTAATVRLIQRISGRRGGIKEDNLLRLFHAFLLSHVNYVASMHVWSAAEKAKLEVLIRQTVKKVLGLPSRTSTTKLEALGVHNKLDELIEAQRTAQISRLSSTGAGKAILARAGITSPLTKERAVPLPDTVRSTIAVYPLPRNMNPVHNQGRRRARAKAYLSLLNSRRENALFVDASRSGPNSFVAAVVDMSGRTVSAASVRTKFVGVAEQVAISLALTTRDPFLIFSDSMTAVRSFDANQISLAAHSILTHNKVFPHELTWFPAHMGASVDGIANPNELAHARARGLIHRPGQTSPPPTAGEGSGGGADGDPLTTFHEITSHYRLDRKSFTDPHRELTRRQEIALRLLQTESFPSPATMAMYTDISPNCLACNQLATFPHLMWRCPRLRVSTRKHHVNETDFFHCIASSDLAHQLRAVQGACEAIGNLWFPTPTRAMPSAGS